MTCASSSAERASASGAEGRGFESLEARVTKVTGRMRGRNGWAASGYLVGLINHPTEPDQLCEGSSPSLSLLEWLVERPPLGFRAKRKSGGGLPVL